MTGGEKQVYKDQPRPHLEDRGPMQRPPIFWDLHHYNYYIT